MAFLGKIAKSKKKQQVMKHYKSKSELITLIVCVIALIGVVVAKVRMETADFVPTISIIATAGVMAGIVALLVYADIENKRGKESNEKKQTH